MNNDMKSRETYWNSLQESVKTRVKELRKENEDISECELQRIVPEELTDWGGVPNNSPVYVLMYCDNGLDEPGWSRYSKESYDDGREMLFTLSRIAYYNDLSHAIDRLFEIREELGEMMNLIDSDSPIYGEGVTFEYEYERGMIDPIIVTYTFECLGEGEWRVVDPDGESFEIISPRVMIKDEPFPERTFQIYLDNICGQQERRREMEGDDE